MLAIGPSSAQTVAAPAPMCVDCRNSNAEGAGAKETDSTRPVTSPPALTARCPKGLIARRSSKRCALLIIQRSLILLRWCRPAGAAILLRWCPAGRRGKATRHLVIHLTEVRHVWRDPA